MMHVERLERQEGDLWLGCTRCPWDEADNIPVVFELSGLGDGVPQESGWDQLCPKHFRELVEYLQGFLE